MATPFKAALANLAYQPKNTRRNLLRKISKDSGRKLQLVHSSEKMFVCVEYDGRKMWVSHRGTVLKDLDDVLTDAAIAGGLGELTQRFRAAKKITVKMMNKFKDFSNNVEHVGHSLGGWVAKAVAKNLGQRSTVFNPYSPPEPAVKKALGGNDVKHESHIVMGDPIGMTDSLGHHSNDKKFFYKMKGGKNPHTIDNFL